MKLILNIFRKATQTSTKNDKIKEKEIKWCSSTTNEAPLHFLIHQQHSLFLLLSFFLSFALFFFFLATFQSTPTIQYLYRISTVFYTGQWRMLISPPRYSPPITSYSPSTPPPLPPPMATPTARSDVTTSSLCRLRQPWTPSATARRRWRGCMSGWRRCCVCRWRCCGSRCSGCASPSGTWRRRWRWKGGRTRRIPCRSGGVGLCGSQECAPDAFCFRLGTLLDFASGFSFDYDFFNWF